MTAPSGSRPRSACVVGAGLTGAVIARRLRDTGWNVVVVERRHHIGGHVHDHVHESGIRVHSYGPHYFRTSSARVWSFVSRYAVMRPYTARVRARIGGRLEPWPVNRSLIPATHVSLRLRGSANHRNFEEAAIALLSRRVYDIFVREYTRKQWGVDPSVLDASLAGRLRINPDGDDRLTPHAAYQALPTDGYTALIRRLLEGVELRLSCDYLRHRGEFTDHDVTVFSGPIDEFFGFRLGRLQYRTQRRKTVFHPMERRQAVAQVNYPSLSDGPQIRSIEWKHLMPADAAAAVTGTLVTIETPDDARSPEESEYPFPDDRNRRVFDAYARMAADHPALRLCGRLGEYRYLDMDQAIARALVHADRILAEHA